MADPADGYSGSLVIVRSDDPATGLPLLWIERADPRCRICAWTANEGLSVSPLPGAAGLGFYLAQGNLLRIVAVNRTVVYRLRSYEKTSHTYLAEWPD